ncbi:MAG: hypothetical protein RL223_1080 [Pseudomonadota bacterium]|jgi:HlyD family secretion protein
MSMTLRKRAVLAAGGLALVAALAWAFSPRPLAVQTATVTRGLYEQAIEEDGRTRLRERWVLSAPVAGRLQRITLREGDAVAEGDTVAWLQPGAAPLLDARTERQNRAQREAAAAAVQRALATEAQARTAREQAELAERRSAQLAAQGFVSATQRDADRLNTHAARQGLEAASAAVRMAREDLVRAEAALAPPAAALPLSRAGGQAPLRLRAPHGGQVLAVPLTSETSVAAGTALLEIGDLRQLEVVAELLTADAVQARAGAPVQIDRWGGETPLRGRVRRVEPAGYTKVSALGVEEQRVKVLIDIDPDQPAAAALGDGWRVGLRILTLRQTDALQLPVAALFPRPDAPDPQGRAMAVYTVDAEGHARLRPVTLGGRNGQQAWLRDGLAAGATVIVYPPAGLTEGARVQARTP